MGLLLLWKLKKMPPSTWPWIFREVRRREKRRSTPPRKRLSINIKTSSLPSSNSIPLTVMAVSQEPESAAPIAVSVSSWPDITIDTTVVNAAQPSSLTPANGLRNPKRRRRTKPPPRTIRRIARRMPRKERRKSEIDRSCGQKRSDVGEDDDQRRYAIFVWISSPFLHVIVNL